MVEERTVTASDVGAIFRRLGLTGAAAVAPIGTQQLVGLAGHDLVTPASVMKVQVAVAALDAVAGGRLDGSSLQVLPPAPRTPGPVGLSLLEDEVRMSLRDLVVLMLTVSDNVATDAVIAATGLDEVNAVTTRLGLEATRVTFDLRTMLDGMAREVGFLDYGGLAAHVPAGPSTREVLLARLDRSTALDPERGSRTTAAETVALLQAIWTDVAAHPDACAQARRLMGQQLTRQRIASGFGPEVSVAAKSGGLMGIVRNEAGVVTYPDGKAYAVAVFTRAAPASPVHPAAIDAGIGDVARTLVEELRGD